MKSLRKIVSPFISPKVKRWVSLMGLRYGPVPPLHVVGSGDAVPSPYPFWITCPNVLTELGEKFRPTKRFHNYLPHYWLHFRDVRESVRSVVEIGVETDRSIRMWEEFFPNATIYGIDINPVCKQYESGRIKIFIGSQADTGFLNDCLRQMERAPDIIIDDGSHRVDHQIITFNHLFSKLSTHGIYAIEDTGGCVNDKRNRTVNRLKTLIDRVFYWPRDPRTHWTTLDRFPESATWLDRNVTGVAFYRWIAFAMRGHNPGDNPYLPMTEDNIQQDSLAPYGMS